MHLRSNKQSNPSAINCASTLHCVPMKTGTSEVYAPPPCSLGLSWEKADNIFHSMRLSRETNYVFYLNYENKDKILQNALGSMLVGTCRLSIYNHRADRQNSVQFATAAFVKQSCMATVCISIFYIIALEKEVENLFLFPSAKQHAVCTRC